MKLVLGCLFIVMALEVYFAPYTKVEESFNLQAVHDMLNRVKQFDHVEFPGVVPRTFLGALAISMMSWPFVHFLKLNSIQQQILVRVVLGSVNVTALGFFSYKGVGQLFGKKASTVTIVLLLCQFHLVFWASRTLPNMFALPWVSLGLSHWFSSLSQSNSRDYHLSWMIRYLTLAAVVFRFEVGILLVVILASELYHQKIALVNTVQQILITALFSLIISVPLDSYLWNQWIWPEGMVFYFNAILNKSSEWGTLPFYSYFLSFLPRLLLISYPLAIAGYAMDTRIRRILTPMIAYVLIFSYLPHKEWRFIVYTVPVFTAAAASAQQTLLNTKKYTFVSRAVFALGCLASFIVSMFLFQISRLNYPGGEALANLHKIEHSPFVSVHLDTYTAMTGASLFGQHNPNWQYSKNEHHVTEQDFIEARYTHLITATPERFDKSLFEIVDETLGFEKLVLDKANIFKLPIQLKTSLYTLKLIQPQKTWVQHTIHKYPVVLYSKTYCPYCRAAKQLISKYCDKIHVVEVDMDRDARNIQMALIQLTGQRTFPNLFRNGESLGGFDRLSALDRQGLLNDLCK